MRSGLDWYAMFFVAIALAWLLFLEAYDRLVVRPRQRREDRAEITQFWFDAFDRYERGRAKKQADITANIIRMERVERMFDEDKTPVQRGPRMFVNEDQTPVQRTPRGGRP